MTPNQILTAIKMSNLQDDAFELCSVIQGAVHTIPNLTMGCANFWDNMVCLTEGPIQGFDDTGWN